MREIGRKGGKARRAGVAEQLPPAARISLRDRLRDELDPAKVQAAIEQSLAGGNESARVAAVKFLADLELYKQDGEEDRAKQMRQAAGEAREYVRVKVAALARQAHRDGKAELAQALEQAAHELWSETKLPDPVVVGDISPSECAEILEGLAQRGLIRPPLQPGEVDELERLKAENAALRGKLVA